jgi:hypothetical protein
MGGIYNKFQDDGIVGLMKKKTRCSVFAIDFNTKFLKIKPILTQNLLNNVNVPETYSQIHLETNSMEDLLIFRSTRFSILGWEKAVLNVACRLNM